MVYKFYDTCSLLLKANHLFDDSDKVVISSSEEDEELDDLIKGLEDGDIESLGESFLSNII